MKGFRDLAASGTNCPQENPQAVHSPGTKEESKQKLPGSGSHELPLRSALFC